MKNKKMVLVVLLLVALVVAGNFYTEQQETQNPNSGQFWSSTVETAILLEDDVLEELNDSVDELFDENGVAKEIIWDEQAVFYEVKVRLEDLGLYSSFPSLDNEENLKVENFIFNGEDGMLRGVLVSIEPVLDFFNVGDILMLETNHRELTLAVPGDLVTFHCEVKSKLSGYCADLTNLESCSELFKFESCVLVKVNH